jgi:hypothetical protein
VFNVADSAITCGVIAILIFQRRFFGKHKKATDVAVTYTEASTEETSGNTEP